jgi:outer membrane lipoprotein-sorting protein
MKLFTLSPLYYVLLLSLILSPATLLAKQNETNNNHAKKILYTYLSQLQSISASFTQKTISQNGNTISQSFGSLWLKKDQLRFETKKPLKQIILVHQNDYELIEPDLRQISYGHLNSQQMQSFAQILTSPAILLHQSITVTYKLAHDGKKQFHISWNTQKTNNKIINQLTISLNKSSLKALSWIDPLQQTTTLTLRPNNNNNNNTTITAELFNYRPPKNWQIINLSSKRQ